MFIADREGMPAALVCELATDVIAPTENDAHTEIMKRADGLMMHLSVETAIM